MDGILFALYVIVSGIHLYFSWKDEPKGRAATKPWILLLLIGFYLWCGKGEYSVFLLLALFTSWLGDVLLIPKGHNWFTFGGISFMFSHVFFICVYTGNIDFHLVNFFIAIPVAILYYGIAGVIIYNVAPTTPKKMIAPMYVYLIANATMNVFALMQLMSNRSLGTKVAYIGAVLFFISDCLIFLVRYYRKNVVFKRHFTVMLTYVLGELFITIGLLIK